MRIYTFTVAALLIITLAHSSCKYMSKEPSDAVNVTNNQRLQDTLNKLYPTLRQGYFGAEVHEFRDVKVNLGDKELYNMPDDKLQDVAKNIGQIVYKIYDANNYLDKGTLIITESETQAPNDAMPKKTFDLHLAEIVKANEK